MQRSEKIWTQLGMSLLAILLMVTACSSIESDEKVLNIAREIPSDTINYLINDASNNAQIITNFSEGLIRYNQERKLIPALAEKWENKDNIYTFTLRKDLKWSNGTPLTAADFVFGWQTLATLPTAPYNYFMKELKNGSAVVAGDKPATELGVKAIDERTLEVTLEQDRAYILGLLADSPFLPLNEAFYKEVGADAYGTSAETVLASGPFKLAEYNPSEGYTMVKNKEYWNVANIHLDRVNTRVIKESATQDTLYGSNELDVVEVPATLYDKYANDPDVVDFAYARLYYFYISGDTATRAPALANEDFRAAIGYAIDKETLATNVFKDGSKPLDYLVPRDFGDINGKSYREFTGDGIDGTYKFDVAKAQEFLAKAKSVLAESDLSFKIVYQEKEENKRVFENVKSQLETNLPGVTVSVESLPGQTYFKELMKKEQPAGYSGWLPDYNDIATYFEVFLSGNGLNFSNYNNLEYDSLYKKGQDEKDPVKRAQLFQQAEKLLVDEGKFVPLAQRGKRYAVKSKVKGFNFNSLSPEIDFRYISIE